MVARSRVSSRTALTMIGLAALAFAADDPKAASKPPTAAQCERLVEQLVNPKKRPFEGYVFSLPEGTSISGLRKTQEPIADAYNQLSAAIEVALPVLADHIGDRRFSYVYEEGITGTYHCESVGPACQTIIYFYCLGRSFSLIFNGAS